MQFGKPLIDFQLTQYKLGWMATQLAAARAITYAAAAAMDEDERKAVALRRAGEAARLRRGGRA